MNKEHLKYLPFGIATFLTIQYLLSALFTVPDAGIADGNLNISYSFTILNPIMYGSIGLFITLVLILLKKRIWKYIFLILILLSFTPWLMFWNYSWSIGINSLHIELLPLGLLIFHLSLNPEIVKPLSLLFKSNDVEIQSSEDIKARNFENRIKDFEKKFSKKTNEQLQQIVTKKELIPEAIEAAERILRTK